MSLVLIFYDGGAVTVDKTDSPNPPSYIARPSLHASEQLAFAAPDPSAIPAATVPFVVGVVADTVGRATAHAARFDANSEPVAPERTAPLASAVHADRIDRAKSSTLLHASTSSLEPKPEGVGRIEWTPHFPERARRPFLAVAAQLAFFLAPAPERTAPLASEVHADTTRRLSLHASQQLAASSIPPKPEEQVQRDWAPSYVDSVRRPWLPSSAHQAFATSPQPERASPLADTSFPEAARRPAFGAHQQLAAAALSPKPERSFGFSDPVYPEATRRPAFAAAQQLAITGLSPKPERTSPLLSWATVDRIERATLHASQQFACVGSSLPIPNGAITPVALTYYPDGVARPAFAAAQQALVAGSPFPLPNPTFFAGDFPPSVVRPRFEAARQAAFVGSPFPIASVLTPVALTWFPDGIVRPTFAVSRQLAVTLAAKPERTAPLASDSHVDAVARPSLHASQQLAVTELSPRPERTSALAVSVEPDAVTRPWLATARQQAFVGSPQPERTRPIAVSVEPDFVSRLTFHAAQQLAVTELSPKPERKAPLAVSVEPDFATRRFYPVAEQPAFAISTQPIVAAITQFPTTFSDTVYRPTFGAWEQAAFVDPRLSSYVLVVTGTSIARATVIEALAVSTPSSSVADTTVSDAEVTGLPATAVARGTPT